MSDFDALCAEYLDGSLDEAGRDRLVALLEAEAGLRDELRRQLRVSGALARLRPEQSDETFVRTVLPHLGSVAGEAEREFPDRVMSRIRFVRFKRAALAMAALVALAGALVLLSPRAPGAGEADGVARLFNEEDGVEKEIRIGDELDFTDGVTRLEFDNGAVVAVEAPAALSIRSAAEIVLEHGRLNAWCPESAHGFQVVTHSATLTDLGTSFGVSADTDGNAEFVVLDGKVEVVQDGEKRTLLKGNAVRTGRQKGFRKLDFKPAKFRRTWPVVSGIRATRGEVVVAPPDTPEALALMEDDDQVLVIPERRGFVPRSAIPVDMIEPGTQGGKLSDEGPLVELAPGRRVRSYLLRYNPVGKVGKKKFKRFKGSVTFDRPVLAIITSSGKLNHSDALFSKTPLPPVDADSTEMRGIERVQGPNPPDRVTLSKNRRTITVTFHAGESVDEIRAITADDRGRRPKVAVAP